MDLKQQILHYYRVDELSLREIARKTGADRKTVTRLINDFEAAIKADPDMGIDEFLATINTSIPALLKKATLK
ncbi:MAG: MarR family transcriptional regulator [Bacteroidales bacterium]|nr:MarR family transcriptional regulator [Bacteroidales bacterium]